MAPANRLIEFATVAGEYVSLYCSRTWGYVPSGARQAGGLVCANDFFFVDLGSFKLELRTWQWEFWPRLLWRGFDVVECETMLMF